MHRTEVRSVFAETKAPVAKPPGAIEVTGATEVTPSPNPLKASPQSTVAGALAPAPSQPVIPLPQASTAAPTDISRPRWERITSRTVDILAASLALVVLLPLMVLIALGIRATSPGPALFKQDRVGRGRENFKCYKFRTMRTGCDDAALRDLIARQLRGENTCSNGSWKIANDDRVTPFGSFLRRSSFDELPQLFNVLFGSMSLVGPRPMLEWQVESFPREYDDRFAVRPGVTGLWQVSGRSTISIVDMLALDARYVRERSLVGDLAILVRTVPVVLRGDGAR
jgi:lipopolysaccharide/colanic/teichoic acid biosynthesis glycosyltransferase